MVLRVRIHSTLVACKDNGGTKTSCGRALALTGLAGFDQIDSRGMMLTSPPCDAVNTKGEREVKHATNPRTLTLALLPLHHGEDLQGRIEAIGADVLGRDDDAVGLFERVKEYSDVQAVDEPGCEEGRIRREWFLDPDRRADMPDQFVDVLRRRRAAEGPMQLIDRQPRSDARRRRQWPRHARGRSNRASARRNVRHDHRIWPDSGAIADGNCSGDDGPWAHLDVVPDPGPATRAKADCDVLADDTVVANYGFANDHDSALVGDLNPAAERRGCRELDAVQISDDEVERAVKGPNGMANQPAATKAPGAEPVHRYGVKAGPRPRPPVLDPVFMHHPEEAWLGL